LPTSAPLESGNVKLSKIKSGCDLFMLSQAEEAFNAQVAL
jgi:hypothetical protein